MIELSAEEIIFVNLLKRRIIATYARNVSPNISRKSVHARHD
jgi:hypothetical protein